MSAYKWTYRFTWKTWLASLPFWMCAWLLLPSALPFWKKALIGFLFGLTIEINSGGAL